MMTMNILVNGKVVSEDNELYDYLVTTGDRSKVSEICNIWETHGMSSTEATKKAWEAIHAYEQTK